jgi:hypothetical protein
MHVIHKAFQTTISQLASYFIMIRMHGSCLRRFAVSCNQSSDLARRWAAVANSGWWNPCGPAATRFFAVKLYRQAPVIIPAMTIPALM